LVKPDRIWIARDYVACSGCRRCEIACSLFHEGKIWPEASRIRIFAPAPTIEIPHLCTQCDDAPCIANCPVNALSMDEKTGAITVDKKVCTGCGTCVNSCPAGVPTIHPTEKYALICDLCGGDPQCVKACQEGGFNALRIVKNAPPSLRKLYTKTPNEIAKELAYRFYGEFGEELI